MHMNETTGQVSAEAGRYGDVIAALQGRAAFYDLLASVYFKPLTAEQVENFAHADFSAYGDVNEEFASGINDIRRYLAKRNTGTRQELAVDYTSSFGSVSSWKGRYAAPYESVHTSEEGLMFQDSYHEVYQFFKQQNVERGENFDYPHDHLSFLCTFEGILSQRIIDALREDDLTEALYQVALAGEFLQQHILSWYDTLADLALKLIKTRFYRGIISISKGFFLFDEQLLADIADELEAVQQG